MNSVTAVPYHPTGGGLAPLGQPQFDPPDMASDKLDVRWLLSVFNRRRVLFLSVFAFIVAAAILFTVTRTPMYSAIASVTIDSRQLPVSPTQNGLTTMPGEETDSGAVSTQVEIVSSRSVADRVVRELDLDHNPEYTMDTSRKVGFRGRMMANIRHALKIKDPVKKTLSAEAAHQAVIDEVLGRLEVMRVNLSYIISISYSDPDPELAAKIANTFAQVYLNNSVEEKLTRAKQASGLLSGRLQELADQAARDNAAVQQYKIAHGLMSVSGATLTEQEIANFNQQLAQARAAAAEDRARLNTAQQQLRAGSTGDDVGEALDSGVVSSLRTQRATVSGHLAELSSRYGPQHPEILKAQHQLEDIDNEIRAQIKRIISNLQAKVDVSHQRVASMEESLNQTTGTLAANNRAQAGLDELLQRATASQTLYENYLNRFKEVSTGVGTEQSDGNVVSAAKVPIEPSSPRVLLNIAAGVILGLTAGLAAIVIAEALDSSFRTGEELERRVHAPYLGSIPLLSSVAPETKLSPARYAVAKPLSIYAEAFRNLRVSLLYSSGGPSKVIGLTSALTNEGKTTAAVCLAQTSAIQGSRTVVVDCDLRRRTILRYLDEKPEVGLLEVLEGKATLDEALIYLETGAAFLPLVPDQETHDDVLGSARMDEVLQELRERFDLVILDTAPLLILSDTRALAAKCDSVIMLVRWRKTPEAAVKSALRLLLSSGANVAGLVLSKVDATRQAPYGYEDAGYYIRSSKNYFR